MQDPKIRYKNRDGSINQTNSKTLQFNFRSSFNANKFFLHRDFTYGVPYVTVKKMLLVYSRYLVIYPYLYIASHTKPSLLCKVLNKRKLYRPFLWMGFNCLKATQPLQGGSLLFTTKFPEIPGTHLIDLGRMKDLVDLGATQWF